MKLDKHNYKYATTITHQGVVFAFASRAKPPSTTYEIGYTLLQLDAPNAQDDDSWFDFQTLHFPTQLRPAGMRLITLDVGTTPVAADAPFQVVSDGAYLYIFRQSTSGTLLVDRFVADMVNGKLDPVREVRYRRSRNPDVPASAQDSFGSTDMDGQAFIEPTTELTMIQNLTKRQFAVLIVPTGLENVSRWQIFVCATAGTATSLQTYSFLRSSDGLFDLTDAIDPVSGNILPDHTYTLTVPGAGPALAAGPAALLYSKQEQMCDEYGRQQNFKREARVMLALPVTNPSGTAILDWGVGQDGKLAQVVDGTLPFLGAPTPGTALAFNGQQSQVTIPTLPNAPTTAFTIEAWVQLSAFGPDTVAIIQCVPPTGTGLVFILAIDPTGVPILSVWSGNTSLAVQGKPLMTGTWYHLAGTFDSTTASLRLYVNGHPFTDAPSASLQKPSGTATWNYVLGNSGISGNKNGFTGLLDEIRLWNRALDQPTILRTMTTTIASTDPAWSGIVGYWPLDEIIVAGNSAPPISIPNNVPNAPAGTVSGARWVASNAPVGTSMPVVAWDNAGLTLATTLLPFAQTAATPSLFAGADGLVHLYFQNATNQGLNAVHYDTLTARAQYTTSWQANGNSGTLRFIARQAGAAMPWPPASPIAIVPDNTAGSTTYTVTLSGYNGYTEVWQKVPGDVTSFLQVLNGQAAQVPLPNAAVELPKDTLTYDYTSVTARPAGGQPALQPTSGTGSVLFRVSNDSGDAIGLTPMVVSTQDAANSPILDRVGVDNWWTVTPPRSALQFGAQAAASYVQVPASNQLNSQYNGSLNLTGHMCMEAWINPSASGTLPASGTLLSTIMIFNRPGVPGSSQGTFYLLGLDAQGNLYSMRADESGLMSVTNADQPVEKGTWSHVAATYRSGFGLQLDGDTYLDARHVSDLNSTKTLIAEGWLQIPPISRKKVDHEQGVISKRDADGNGWRLGLKNGIPFFEVTVAGHSAAKSKVAAPSALSGNDWHHIAGVYDVATKNEMAVLFTPAQANGSCITTPAVPAVTTLTTNAFTIEAWVLLSATLTPPRSASSTNYVFTAGNGGFATQQWIFSLYLDNTGKPTLLVNMTVPNKTPLNTCVAAANTPLPANTWTHLAATYEQQAGLKLYINGQLAGSTTTAPTPGGFPTLQSINMYQISSATPLVGWPGWINEVSLWNISRSIEDIRATMDTPLIGDENGLVHYWPLQDRFGSTAFDSVATTNGTLTNASFVPVRKGMLAQKLLVDGVVVATAPVSAPMALPSASVRLGADGPEGKSLTGAIGTMRLWKGSRNDWEIEQYRTHALPVDPLGLVAEWTFDAGAGRVVTDTTGKNDARIMSVRKALTDGDIKAMWVAMPKRMSWTLFVNGKAVPSHERKKGEAPSIDPRSLAVQCSIGGRLPLPTNTPVTGLFAGQMAELRIWSEQRTSEQIRENMNRPLTGREQSLAGYWPFDDGSGRIARDQTGQGNDGAMIGASPLNWTLASAPLGDEPPGVGATNVSSPSTQLVQGAAAMAEYGDLQRDADGKLAAVAQWCLVYVDKDQHLNLLPSYKVGDLDFQYVGQVQTRPTVVGYIEGAPPLPSENLTVDSPNTPYKYLAASAITLNEADNTTLLYSAARDRGFDMNMDFKVGRSMGAEVLAVAPGQAIKVADWEAKLGIRGVFDHSLGWLTEARASASRTSNIGTTIEVFGSWETNTYAFDLNVKRLYLPNNKGLALVKSGTADLYALRLKGNGALVAYSMQPNPDIPEDTNLIMFALNPQYVRNGTLDGWIGTEQFQPDYSHLQPGQSGSYFKPLEAYALKKQIEREQKQLKTAYERFDAVDLGQRWEGWHFGDSDPAKTNLSTLIGQRAALTSTEDEAPTGDEWQEALAQRSLVNTYLWNSDGGLYAEEEQFAVVREESRGGSYDFVGKAGAYATLNTYWGLDFALDALFGGHIRTKVMKIKQEGQSFGISVKAPGEGFLNARLPDTTPVPLGAYPVPYESASCPGKVNQYRFMSFYLTPSKRNFDDLATVIDPDWLDRQGIYAGTTDPDATALKQALANTNAVWRVLHRVTYVNRVLGAGSTDTGQKQAPAIQQPDDDSIASNVLLLRTVSVPPTAGTNILPAIRTALAAALPPQAAGAQSTVWQQILYSSPGVRDALFQNVMTYMQYRAYLEIVGITIVADTPIQANTPSIYAGSTNSVQLHAIGTIDGIVMDDVTASVAWNADDTDVATVSATGLVTGIQTGGAQITARWQTSSASILLNVVGVPTINGLSLSSGSYHGGYAMTISGSGFTSDATVNFKEVQATITSITTDGTKITVTVPPSTRYSITVQVTVTTRAGESNGAPFNYTFDDP